MRSASACTCQYPTNAPEPITPWWYITVKTCPHHAAFYDPEQAPEWAATLCGEGGRQVIADRQARRG